MIRVLAGLSLDLSFIKRKGKALIGLPKCLGWSEFTDRMYERVPYLMFWPMYHSRLIGTPGHHELQCTWLLDLLTLCMLGNFACFLLSVDFLLKLTFSKKSFRNTIRVSNNLDPDQARCFFGPDLNPNGLQWLSTEDKKSPLVGKELYRE